MYSTLLIRNNEFLQDIWNLTLHPNLTVVGGNVLIVANARLCAQKIREFFNSGIVLRNATVGSSDMIDSLNGFKAICEY